MNDAGAAAILGPLSFFFRQEWVVVEAVFENIDLKKRTFADLGRVTRPDCVLASNTSTLDINEIARSSPNAQLVLAPLGQLIGEPDFGPATRVVLSALECGAFGAAVASRLRQSRQGRDCFAPASATWSTASVRSGSWQFTRPAARPAAAPSTRYQRPGIAFAYCSWVILGGASTAAGRGPSLLARCRA